MRRWLRVLFRCLYLAGAGSLMMLGLAGLSEVRDVTGTLLGGGSADLFSIVTTCLALLLLWLGVLFRLRGAQWLTGSLLVLGITLCAYSLATYPPEASDPSMSVVFSPSVEGLYGTLVFFMGLFLLVLMNSARSRRWLRVALGPRCKLILNHGSVRIIFLGLAVTLLLLGWVGKLYMNHLVDLRVLQISFIEALIFNTTLSGLLLLGFAMALRWPTARWVLAVALLAGIALSVISLLALPLSLVGQPIAFAPTIEDLSAILWLSALTLGVVVLSAPSCRQAWRNWWKRQTRRFSNLRRPT